MKAIYVNPSESYHQKNHLISIKFSTFIDVWAGIAQSV
jgi:hypothetical protein